MMFSPSASHRSFQSRARDIAETLDAAAHERDELVPMSVYRALADQGLMSVKLEEALGGPGGNVVSYSLAMTEVAKACASTAVTMAVTNMVGEVIHAFGTDAQRETYCSALARGGLGAFALSEVGAGSDPGGMRTTATKEGDHYLITGDKQWISHGDAARVLVVWARTGGAGSKGISCFLVDGDADGVSVAKHEDKLGLRASHTAALVFENVRVHESALLGSLGGGFRIAMMALDGGRIGIASQAIGIAEAALADTLTFVQASPALRSSQDAQWRLADARMKLDAASLLTLRAAELKDRGESFSLPASMAKVFATETAWAVCQSCVELQGERAERPDSIAARCMRDVRVTMIYEGTSEVQRIVISRAILT